MSENTRTLAAIMFTDIVGYTALMQEDEHKAKKLRDKHRLVLESSIEAYHGKILQYYGDGTLSMFNSAIEAAKSAIDIQKELSIEPKIPLRIGIHIGDIVQEDEGIYGDGVNVASRIENLSVPGAVLISDKIFDELSNKPELEAKSLGTFKLKNVKKPVEVFALTSEGLIIPEPDDLNSSGRVGEKSIAVLPFVNMSSDQENEYFSDGITEELLNSLTRIEGLKVTARTSSFAFKGLNKDIREIGAKLNVNTVLEGSVRKAGNRVRITSQLINVSDGYHLWSETFDRNLEDIFAVQDEISKTIVNKLRTIYFDEKPKESLVKPPIENLEAYNIYLKGKYYYHKWTPDSILKAIEYFNSALKLEPDFAQALSWMAISNITLAALGYLHPDQAYPKGKELALRSLEIDDNIVESHISLVLVKVFFEWDFEGSYDSLKKASEISGNSVDYYGMSSFYYSAIGEYEKAVVEGKKAVELDPLSLGMNGGLGFRLFLAQKYDEAIKQAKKTLELDPDYILAKQCLTWVYAETGEVEKAIEIGVELQKLTNYDLKNEASLAFYYAKAGNSGKARECLDQIFERMKEEKNITLSYEIALIYYGLNDYDNVFHYFEKAYEERSAGMIYLTKNPTFRNLWEDPRYKNIIERIGN